MTLEEKALEAIVVGEDYYETVDIEQTMKNIVALVRQELEACAQLCDAIQAAGDNRSFASADPAEGSDGAQLAAHAIRARCG